MSTDSPKPAVAQTELGDVEQRMRSIVEHVVDGIISSDENGTITTFNQAAERLFGYSAPEAIGQNVKMLMPEPYQRQHDGYVQHYVETGQAKIIGVGREVVGRRKDGSTFPMELAISEFSLRGQRHFTGIVRDITERKRLERELNQKLEELARADRQKNEFLAMLGHELRNPLAPIRNAIHIMKTPAVPPAVSDRALHMMERQVQQVVHLVDDLLDVSRIVHGKVELHAELLDLRDPVRRACETVLPQIDARAHQLTVDMPSTPVWVKGDATRLAQVVANLLNNAVKYTENVGTIALTVKQEEQVATVSVRDSGIGISPELLPRIFDVFVQGDRSLGRSEGGLGIGLTLARRMIELHDGTISASSPGMGRGSEFVVALPRAAAPLQASFDGTRESASESSGTQPKVLVVDDNLDGCETTATILRFRGYQVRCLHEGSSVLAAAVQWRPDVVVLDIGLPGMSGLEVAAQLRQHSGFERVPLIALTGYGQEADKLRSMRAGFDLHLTKPVDPQTLGKCVSGLLAAGAA